jgi:hypothetical protein
MEVYFSILSTLQSLHILRTNVSVINTCFTSKASFRISEVYILFLFMSHHHNSGKNHNIKIDNKSFKNVAKLKHWELQ